MTDKPVTTAIAKIGEGKGETIKAATCTRCGFNYLHWREYIDRLWEIMDWQLRGNK